MISTILTLVSVFTATEHYTLPQTAVAAQDSVAERMLLYQRNNGGWPQPGGDPIKYNLTISPTLRATLLSEKDKLDTTIDDDATTREIRGLVTAYGQTKNEAYKVAAERGIRYLLTAQNTHGGWPQFYPDSSSYHKHITYNDNAMLNVLMVMKSTAEGKNGFDVLDKSLVPLAQQAVKRGIDCILKTQYVQNGQLTVWCAQHHKITLAPVKARAFELPSLSGNESVGLVKFLMDIPNPSPEIKRSINAAVAWFEAAKLPGIAVKNIEDASQPKGRDRIVVQDPKSTLWARFYDLETNKPLFVGRDSIKRNALAEIENERRVGYAYYGTWPAKLLSTDYPAWVAKWGK